MSFEIVDITLEERTKFRKLLLENMAKGARNKELNNEPETAAAGSARTGTGQHGREETLSVPK
jgi:hypothetical protein